MTFADPNAMDTMASFTVDGTYILRLTADDGELTVSDEVTITVFPEGTTNQPPVVDGGPDQTITLPASASLSGTVTDDGLPNPPGTVTTIWTQVSGPGTVTFADASVVNTTASFSVEGTYILRLTADDGETAASDDVAITVEQGSVTLEIQVDSSSDDAEERASGSMKLTSSDLELVYDKSNQTVGMRFNGVAIPQGATVYDAYIQFQVDETNSGATSLTIWAEAIDDAPTFTSADGNISSRSRTTASVSWAPVPWTAVGQAGPDQRTPNIASVIQEMVNRPGWSSGNALVIIITGTGERTAESYDGDPGGAPLLHVEYGTGGGTPPVNAPPEVDGGPDRTITLPASASLSGTVTDDGLPNPPGMVTTTWTQVTGPGTVTLSDASAVDTTASFSVDGTYILRLTADDSALWSSDDVTIVVSAAGGVPTTAEIRVSASSDDAEEGASGSMKLTSSDLELVYDKSNQTVGMRFNGVAIPQGATVYDAYIQFQVDETNSGATSLTIWTEAIDDAPTFASADGNISSRPRTTASVSWSPVTWTTKAEAGPDQRTPDVASVIQEMVNRPGWSSGNALVIIITGTGERTAESYDGEPAAAPLLHVEYTMSD